MSATEPGTVSQAAAGAKASPLPLPPYRGGFLLARTDRALLRALRDGQRAFGHWGECPIGGYRLHFDPMFPVHHAAAGDVGIVCLGYLCDVGDPAPPARTVARLASAWALSRDAFLDRLIDSGGTYVVFAYRGNEVEVFLDATGTIGVCYAEADGEVVAASHPCLLAELFGFRRSALADFWLNHPAVDMGGRYFPGLKTIFDEVRLLTPNTALRLPTGAVARFYPRHELRERPLDEILATVIPALHRQIGWIAGQASLAVSVSGGLDTRVTLSAMRDEAAGCLFFTYRVGGNQVHKTDFEIATELCARLGLRHLPIVVPNVAPTPGPFVDVWRRTHDRTLGNISLVEAYCERLGGRYVHIRSNVLEVVRGYYTKNPANRDNVFDAYKLARLFRGRVAQEFTPYFEEFVEVTAFTPDALKGYHYTDLFYWEHRMGTWLAGVLRGARADHLTYILYNCRTVIEALIARPLEERVAAAAMFALIREMWPEVLSVPIFSGSQFREIPPANGVG
jgi:hypothetical protein